MSGREWSPRSNERKGQGPHGIVFVHVNPVDQGAREKDDEFQERINAEIGRAVSFMLDLDGEQRCAVLHCIGLTRTWRGAYMELVERFHNRGMLVGVYYRGKGGGRPLLGYFINEPTGITYSELQDELIVRENLALTASEKGIKITAVVQEYNRSISPDHPAPRTKGVQRV